MSPGPEVAGGRVMTTRLVWADGLVLGDAEPLVDGAVVVDESGLVLDVGPAAAVVPRSTGLSPERVRGVVVPGLVNAHTHVELSALRGQVPGGAGFVPWVERFIGARAELAEDDEAAAIEAAALDLQRFGTAAVGDVSNALSAVRALSRAGIGGSVFHEVFGTDAESTLARVRGLGAHRDAVLGSFPWGDLAYAPSPHTLYTTHPRVVRELLALGRARSGVGAVGGVRMTLHLLEHPGERLALERGEGPVVRWLAERVHLTAEQAFWPKASVLDYAASLGALGPDVLLVHLTDARAPELARIAEAGAPLVLCPRSNLYIETKLPPLDLVLSAGLEPALGTDSLASNTSLDVLAEARALRDRFPSVASSMLVRMATWNGARALGRPDLGRIAKGARPGLVAVEGTLKGDPAAFVLDQVRAPRRWIHGRTAEVSSGARP